MTKEFLLGSITFGESKSAVIGIDKSSEPDATFVSMGTREGVVNFNCGKHAAVMELNSCPYCKIDDYEEVMADHRRLVRELDVLLNGEDGAAKQASLCDLVAQIVSVKRERDRLHEAVNQIAACGYTISEAVAVLADP